MKKFFLIVLALGLCSNLLFANERMNYSKSPDLVIIIRINLHSRSSNCESGFGFCRFSIGIGKEDSPSGGSGDLKAQAYLNSSNQLVLQIAESDLQLYDGGKSMQYFKDKNSITLKEDYEVGPDVSRALGATKPLVIHAGTYRVNYENGVYTMIFPQ